MKYCKFIIGALLIIIIALNIPLFSRFVIANGKTGELVLIEKVDAVEEFVVSFRHSVNRTPVNEFIRIQGDEFIVYKTTFYSYGAGMPELDTTGTQRITIEDGLVKIDNINRKLKSFTYLVGTYAEHTLSYKDKSIRLSDVVKPQNPAFFCIRRITLFQLLKHYLKVL